MVSVGMPVYNAEKFIERAIQSVLNQTYTNFELIVTDDGSTDNSVAIIKTFNDPRIRLITDSVNKGIAHRLNQQINAASGKYFARMDSDDIMFPTRLQEQVSFLKSNPEFDVVGGQAVVIDAFDQVLGLRRVKQQYHYFDAIKGSIFIHPTVLGNLSWFKHHLYDHSYSGTEDHELFVRTFPLSRFQNQSTPILFYREEAKFNLRIYLYRQKKLLLSVIKNHKTVNNPFYILYTIFYILLKSGFVWILNGLGAENFLVKNRNESLSKELIQKYNSLLT